jgi:DNA-binding MarR family transcriptional regulator
MPAPNAKRPTAARPLRTEATSGIVGYRLRRAQLAVFQRFLAEFAELDLRPAEYSVLVLIADNPGCTQSEIADVLGIKRANLVALVKGLEARGLTGRGFPPGDRRANALRITDAGRAFLDKAQATQNAFEAACVERLGGPAERDRLLQLLDRLIG